VKKRTAVLGIDDELLALGRIGISRLSVDVLVNGSRAGLTEQTGILCKT
jgi:hypothetical protein